VRRQTIVLIFVAAIASPSIGLAVTSDTASAQQPVPLQKTSIYQGVLAHQHANDQMLQFFERTEHRQLRERAADTIPAGDRTSRLVPTGAGYVHIDLADRGHDVDAATLRHELDDAARALQDAASGNSSDVRAEREKFQRRKNDRAEVLDSIMDGFIFTRIGHEMRNGRDTAKIHLEPDPNYKAHTRTTEFLKHANATLWVDENAQQVVRIEADVVTDVAIGGILAKVYRGGHIVLEQSEIEPGVWLPTYYQADFTGRKLFLLFEVHEKTETSKYKRVGGAAESLAMIRREIAASQPTHSQ
jgi:hypothetical protein